MGCRSRVQVWECLPAGQECGRQGWRNTRVLGRGTAEGMQRGGRSSSPPIKICWLQERKGSAAEGDAVGLRQRRRRGPRAVGRAGCAWCSCSGLDEVGGGLIGLQVLHRRLRVAVVQVAPAPGRGWGSSVGMCAGWAQSDFPSSGVPARISADHTPARSLVSLQAGRAASHAAPLRSARRAHAHRARCAHLPTTSWNTSRA